MEHDLFCGVTDVPPFKEISYKSSCSETTTQAVEDINQIIKNGSCAEDKIDSIMHDAIQSDTANNLDNARSKGAHGWWDPDVCSMKQLNLFLGMALNRGDMVSVINFASMIHMRKAGVSGDE